MKPNAAHISLFLDRTQAKERFKELRSNRERQSIVKCEWVADVRCRTGTFVFFGGFLSHQTNIAQGCALNFPHSLSLSMSSTFGEFNALVSFFAIRCSRSTGENQSNFESFIVQLSYKLTRYMKLCKRFTCVGEVKEISSRVLRRSSSHEQNERK